MNEKLLHIQILSEIIRFNDGGILYEYDNSEKPLGRGGFGVVYAGIVFHLSIMYL